MNIMSIIEPLIINIGFKMPKCIVRGCHNDNNRKVSIFQLPDASKDLARLRKWLYATGNDDMSLQEIAKCRTRYGVCEHHFSMDSYENFLQWKLFGNRHHLTTSAVSSINLEANIKNAIPLMPMRKTPLSQTTTNMTTSSSCVPAEHKGKVLYISIFKDQLPYVCANLIYLKINLYNVIL